MLSTLLLLLILILAAVLAYPFPQFSDMNQRIENIVDSPDLHNRKIMLPNNEVVECGIEEIVNVIGLEELQSLVEALAVKRGVSPLLLLRKLFRRMRSKEEVEEALLHAVDSPALPDLLHRPIVSYQQHPDINHAPYSLAPNEVLEDNDDDTKVLIIPVVAPSSNKTQTAVNPEDTFRNEISYTPHGVNPFSGKLSNMLPGIFVRHNQLKPPHGAHVRILSGDPLSPLNREIVVTVSPLMTLIEALRQAEIKLRNLFGVSHDTDVVTFTHSLAAECYIINRVGDVSNNEDYGWKITIMEKDGQIAHESFCLPNGQDVLVKPGTIITLTYVPL